MSALPRPLQEEIQPAELVSLLDSQVALQLVDVRESYEREAGHIADSQHIPLGELTARVGELRQDQPIVFYCRVGARSNMAAQAFRASGYDASSMQGGIVRWVSENRPLSPEGGHVADH